MSSDAADLRSFDTSELEIIEREAREGNPQARAILVGGLKPSAQDTMSAKLSETKDQRRKRLTAEHHAKIVSGAIDIGPITVHTGVQTDVRDKRDPAVLGVQVLDRAQKYGSILNGSDYLDSPSGRMETPEYDPGESRATYTARAYRQELEERAAQGDKFAISVLTTGQPGDSSE